MAGKVAIGIQNFEDIRKNDYFYIDKTSFIKEWWDSGDSVTLITRPRRFGKTLNMSMVEQFFSVRYADRGDLFEGLKIWENEEYREVQGTYPVISLSFASVKEQTYERAKQRICRLIAEEYTRNQFLLESDFLTDQDKRFFLNINADISEETATFALHKLADFLFRYYNKRVIILLDEYDTPMQEAYVDGYWDELVAFTRSLFNATFKTNPWLERGIMTGITRVSRESIFSDLNHLKVVTTTSDEYAECFGFTEEEVFAAMDKFGYTDQQTVKRWYDGFIFGDKSDIYNPWSILNYLDTGKITAYWAPEDYHLSVAGSRQMTASSHSARCLRENTSSNSLVGKLLREGNRGIKELFEALLRGETIHTPVDEQIVYSQLDRNPSAIWSLLLASGYLKALKFEKLELLERGEKANYELALTNYEVERMFDDMVHNWFEEVQPDYNDFIKAMLQDDVDAMNEYMNRVALGTFSYFDTGKGYGGEEPERFYHGFVLGLVVDMQNRYFVASNRESGFGRYDVILEPKNPKVDDAFILEFKAFNRRKEQSLGDTLQSALKQIEEKQYAAQLVERGIPAEHIHSYGFAFQGETVLIG